MTNEYTELDSLDFSVHQLSQSLKTLMALLFTRDTRMPLINQLDQIKASLGRWGLERESHEELVLAISHIQRAVEIEDEVSEGRSAHDTESYKCVVCGTSESPISGDAVHKGYAGFPMCPNCKTI